MITMVQKYGGSSLADLERIRLVARHIAESKNRSDRLVVVVSAMGQQTDLLLEQAHSLSDRPSQRELDVLLSAGERISMSLLSIALNDLGCQTVSFTGSQSGIITDQKHGNARIKEILGDRILDALNKGYIAIVAGFQGMNLDTKDITTLGRGGSDLTAIAIADRIKAKSCELYKDVDAIYTADPKIVSLAQPVNSITWDTLSELAWHGAGVVHARAVHLSQKTQIPLEIRSSFKLHKRGTIVRKGIAMEAAKLVALTHMKSMTWVKLSGSASPFLGLISNKLWASGVSSIVSCQRFNGQSYDCDLFIPSAQTTHLVEDPLLKESQISVEKVNTKLASISLIGTGFWQEPEILSKAIETINCPIYWTESKNQSITFVIEEQKLKENLQGLHQAFFPSNS